MEATTIRKTSTAHVGNAQNDWLRSLNFYEQELDILRNRLTEIGGRNTAKDVAVMVDHYENQFTIQQDNIDRLKHEIRGNISAMSQQASSGAGHVDYIFVQRFSDL